MMEYEYVILFNQPIDDSTVFKPKAISVVSLEKAKAEGKIVDYVIDQKGVRIKRKLQQ